MHYLFCVHTFLTTKFSNSKPFNLVQVYAIFSLTDSFYDFLLENSIITDDNEILNIDKEKALKIYHQLKSEEHLSKKQLKFAFKEHHLDNIYNLKFTISFDRDFKEKYCMYKDSNLVCFEEKSYSLSNINELIAMVLKSNYNTTHDSGLRLLYTRDKNTKKINNITGITIYPKNLDNTKNLKIFNSLDEAKLYFTLQTY
jgi:hypothetical protein